MRSAFNSTSGGIFNGTASTGGAPALPAPANLRLVGGNGGVIAFWDSVIGGLTYNLERSTDNTNWSVISSAQAGLNYQDTSATASATSGLVFYRVSANGISGSSSYSASKSTSPWMLFDDATDTDGTLITAHNPALNQYGNAYSLLTDGTVQVTSNKFVVGTGGGGGFVMFGLDANQVDLKGQTSLQLANGILLRFIDTTHYFEIGLSSNLIAIYENNNGTVSTRASSAVVASSGNDYPISWSVIGNVITVTFLNSNTTISYTISASYAGSLSATKLAWILNNGGAIDNIRVAVGSNLPGMIVDLPGDNGTAATWSDATTAGNNATQATGANQMLPVASVLNGHKIMRGNTASIMDLPNIHPNAHQFTHMALVKPSNLTSGNAIIAGNSANSVSALLWMNSSAFPEADVFNSGAVVRDAISNQALDTSNWHLVINNAWYDNPLGLTTVSPLTQQNHLYVDNILAAASGTPQEHPVTRTEVSVGGVQGATTVGFNGDMGHIRIASSLSGPSAADMNRNTAELNYKYALNFPLFNKQNIYIGDSITCGYKAPSASWASSMIKADRSRWHINKGQPSIGLQGSNSILGEISTQFAPIVACGVPTSAVIFAGTNDIALYSATGAQVYTGTLTLCAALRTMGINKIIVVTMLPRGPSVETQRQALNNALRADGLVHFDALADVETVPAIGAAGANTNLTYFDADGTHPNDTGHGLIFALVSGVQPSGW